MIRAFKSGCSVMPVSMTATVVPDPACGSLAAPMPNSPARFQSGVVAVDASLADTVAGDTTRSGSAQAMSGCASNARAIASAACTSTASDRVTLSTPGTLTPPDGRATLVDVSATATARARSAPARLTRMPPISPGARLVAVAVTTPDGALDPASLTAVTVNERSTPLRSPVTTTSRASPATSMLLASSTTQTKNARVASSLDSQVMRTCWSPAAARTAVTATGHGSVETFVVGVTFEVEGLRGDTEAVADAIGDTASAGTEAAEDTSVGTTPDDRPLSDAD